MACGYSGTPIVAKLGIKSGMEVVALDAPANYEELLGNLPHGASIRRTPRKQADFFHLFAKERANLADQLANHRRTISQDGALWVSWPKTASKVRTDITEDTVRQIALPLGFVDVKVCAVDETWSGLKLVIRKAQRRASRAPG